MTEQHAICIHKLGLSVELALAAAAAASGEVAQAQACAAALNNDAAGGEVRFQA
jgi:hypothetical protein